MFFSAIVCQPYCKTKRDVRPKFFRCFDIVFVASCNSFEKRVNQKFFKGKWSFQPDLTKILLVTIRTKCILCPNQGTLVDVPFHTSMVVRKGQCSLYRVRLIAEQVRKEIFQQTRIFQLFVCFSPGHPPILSNRDDTLSSVRPRPRIARGV